MERRLVPVNRDVDARLVPTGDPVTVPGGTFVTLTQALGGTYTIVFNGNMARIDGGNGDALGFEPEVRNYTPNPDGTVNRDDLNEALKSVYDPEIPVNVVDLGLVYGCEVNGAAGAQKILIDMTLTSPGCGMGPVLVEEIKSRLLELPNVAQVEVNLVFDPAWSRDMMSEEAQLELGLF